MVWRWRKCLEEGCLWWTRPESADIVRVKHAILQLLPTRQILHDSGVDCLVLVGLRAVQDALPSPSLEDRHWLARLNSLLGS